MEEHEKWDFDRDPVAQNRSGVVLDLRHRYSTWFTAVTVHHLVQDVGVVAGKSESGIGTSDAFPRFLLVRRDLGAPRRAWRVRVRSLGAVALLLRRSAIDLVIMGHRCQ